MPDDEYGERLFACVEPEADSTLSVAAIQEFLRGKLANFKVPRDIRFMDALPREAVHVSIRPGGHGITRHAGRRVDVPRVRAEGHLRYDHDALARQLPETGPRAVSANGLTPAAELLATAAIIAIDGRTTIVLP